MSYTVKSTDLTMNGGLPIFFAAPTDGGPFPAAVVMHERYGLVEHTKDLAVRLATAGYVVAAPDLYFEHPDQEALHRGEARLGRPSDRLMFQYLCDTVDALTARDDSLVERLAMMGACATGRYPIVYGANRPLRAAVVLHGAAPKKEWQVNESFPESMPSMIERLEAPVLGMFGEKDHSISVDDVRGFRDLFEQSNKTYDISIYEGAPHGWLNDTMPGRYRPKPAAIAWQQLLDFLAANLGDEPLDGGISWKFSSVKARDYDFTTNERFE